MRVALAVAVVLALLSRTTRADDDAKQTFRAVVDRVDLEPSTLTGNRLRVYLSALAIGGQLLDLSDPKSIRLYVGGAEKKVPYSLGTYAATQSETAIVIVIENAQAYADVLPVIADAIDTKLLAGLKDATTQVAITSYGDTTGSGKLGSLKSARGKLLAVTSDASVADPALLDGVEKALSALKRAKSLAAAPSDDSAPQPERPIRKMIIVIGDGRDRSGDRERVTKLGKRAAKEGVRIHALAYAPNDVRRPLLGLGELAKQSYGTFRWVRGGKADSWQGQVQQIADEIGRQNVITYYLAADDDVAGKKLKIVTSGRTETTSNEIKIPAATCANLPCETGYCAGDRCVVPLAPSGRGLLGWLLLLGGLGLGVVVVFGTIGWAMSKRAPSIPLPPGVVPPPGFAPPVAAPKKVKKGRVAALPIPPTPTVPRFLFLLNGPRAGEKIPLHDGFVIGKAHTCNLVIEDGFTSSAHAKITMDHAGNCRLLDTNSTNGTLCNGARITELGLQPGAVIQIGNTQLRFLAE